MRALTMYQPWASYLMSGLKHYETRSWGTKYRGPLAIHAGVNRDFEKSRAEWDQYWASIWPYIFKYVSGIPELPVSYPYGVVLGIVQVVDCIRMGEKFIAAQTPVERAVGDWKPGRYAWKIEQPQPFAKPIPARGYQNMWNWVAPGEKPKAKPAVKPVQQGKLGL